YGEGIGGGGEVKRAHCRVRERGEEVVFPEFSREITHSRRASRLFRFLPPIAAGANQSFIKVAQRSIGRHAQSGRFVSQHAGSHCDGWSATTLPYCLES